MRLETPRAYQSLFERQITAITYCAARFLTMRRALSRPHTAGFLASWVLGPWHEILINTLRADRTVLESVPL